LASLAASPVEAQEETGYITGAITAQSTGERISRACVEAYATPTEILDSACTGDDGGSYTMVVPAGTYRLRVYDPAQRFATRWAYAADTYDAADPITVVVGQQTVVDVALLDAGAIAGTVTDAVTGQPLSGACVAVLAVGSEAFAAYACTDDSGRYRAVVTDPGEYNVRFSADFYVPEWAHDRPTRDLADVIRVSAAQDTMVDAQLTPLGEITGHVTDLAGNPLAFITVYAFSIDNTSAFGIAETDFDGNYRIRGLPATRYHVLFAERSFGNYVSEWWNDSPDRAHADPVQVALASEVSGIDAALGFTGLITGVVTDAATGQPLAGVCPRAVHAASGEAVEGPPFPQCTGADGRYEINGVGGSSYKVQFQPTDPDHLMQWYKNRPDQQSANRIRVAFGQTVDNVNAALQLGGRISGTLTEAATGQPVEGACAAIGIVDGRQADFPMDLPKHACSDATGQYEIRGVPPGDYAVEFFDTSGSWAWHFYPGVPDRSQATEVRVLSDVETTGINARFVVGGSVSGTILGPDGEEVFACVMAFSARTGDPIGVPGCGGGGYSARGLPTSVVKVHLYAAAAGYQTEWATDEASFATADSFAVTAGSNLPGVNFLLQRAAQ
jgi:hypothetical protein